MTDKKFLDSTVRASSPSKRDIVISGPTDELNALLQPLKDLGYTKFSLRKDNV